MFLSWLEAVVLDFECLNNFFLLTFLCRSQAVEEIAKILVSDSRVTSDKDIVMNLLPYLVIINKQDSIVPVAIFNSKFGGKHYLLYSAASSELMISNCVF